MNEKKRPVWQRVLALIGAILLIGMFVLTIIALVTGAPKKTLFGLILCDIMIPLVIWVFVWIADLLRRHKKDEN